jgi:glutamate transport system permease protein
MSAVTENLNLYLSGLWTTVRLCLWSGVLALVFGTFIATCRVSPVPPLRAFGSVWVTVLRNTPLTVVLFFIAFGLPEIGIRGSYYGFAIAGLALYTSAFVCEALRSGINAVPTGQAEAARAMGLTFTQSLRHVVLPQAFRTAIPPLVSVGIAMIKNSAVAGFFGVAGDLSANGNSLTSAHGYPALPVLTGVVIFFWLLTVPAGLLLAHVERRAAVLR